MPECTFREIDKLVNTATECDYEHLLKQEDEGPEPQETQSYVKLVVNFFDEVRRRVATQGLGRVVPSCLSLRDRISNHEPICEQDDLGYRPSVSLAGRRPD